MDQKTGSQHTPTVAAFRDMTVGIQQALSPSYFTAMFAHEPVVALKSYEYLSQFPRAMPAYAACALENSTHARIALETIAKHEELAPSVPLMLAINEEYPRMLAEFASITGISAPEVIAAMVRSGKLDIDLDNPQETRVLATLAEVRDGVVKTPDTLVQGSDKPQRAGMVADSPAAQVRKS